MLLAVLLFTASAMAQNSVLFYVNDGSMDVQDINEVDSIYFETDTTSLNQPVSVENTGLQFAIYKTAMTAIVVDYNEVQPSLVIPSQVIVGARIYDVIGIHSEAIFFVINLRKYKYHHLSLI